MLGLRQSLSLYRLLQFKVMPFSLQGVPATFQHMMDTLQDNTGDCADARLGQKGSC